MVEYGGRASQNQQLRFSRRPYFICTVFESIRLVCAQYLRNISRAWGPALETAMAVERAPEGEAAA